LATTKENVMPEVLKVDMCIPDPDRKAVTRNAPDEVKWLSTQRQDINK
jgi:hypothetical protein